MLSLLFGLGAALSWGLHDFILRGVAGRAGLALLLTLSLAAGSLVLLPLAVWHGWQGMTAPALGAAALSGVALVLASVGLYRAFAIGPVALVAPICGAYPLGSLALAMLAGRPVALPDWLAVLTIIAGIALVAREPGQASGPRRAAILWAMAGAAGFALTFHFGQSAARMAGEFPATLAARLVALALLLLWLATRRIPLAPMRQVWRPMVLMGTLDVTALVLVSSAGALPHPEHAAVASSIFGIITILLAWRFLGETLRPVQAAGVALVFAGIATLAALA